MNDIYEHKAKKYKYKYLKLKAEYFGGVNDNKFRIGLSRHLPWNMTYFATKDKNKSDEEIKKTFDRRIIECTDIKKNEDINGLTFENNIKGSYNKLQNDRIKEIQNLESNELHNKPQYNIYEFIKHGCPNSQTLKTKLDHEKKELERIRIQQYNYNHDPVVIAQRAAQKAEEEQRLRVQRENDILEKKKYGPPGVSESRLAYKERF